MTEDDKDRDAPDDDARARRAAAAELQEQIDALVRGDAGAQTTPPNSLRDFVEHGGKRRPPEPPPPRGGAPDKAEPQQPDEAEGGTKADG
jgi:hypothetical protein